MVFLQRASIVALSLALLVTGCDDDDGGGGSGPPAPGPATPTVVDPSAEAPAIEVLVLGVGGASGLGGSFAVGDRVAIQFRLEQADGTPWTLAEMVSGQSWLSGPTFNYQRVLPLAEDVLTSSSANPDGSFTYRFAPLPATYAPPLNDTEAFGSDHGELTGEPLIEGTYTAALSFAWSYTVEGESFLQIGEASVELLFGGGAGALAPRKVTQPENCNRCHVRLEAHDGRYRALTLCLMCHTAGAEDLNDPALADGTPGVSIDSRILFHRIHNAAHLPSVVGLKLFESGLPDYTAPPKPLLVAGASGVRDFSAVSFPAFPNRVTPMPAGPGYAALSDDAKAIEDRVRTGVTACALCHGDPDGAGPIEAPAQGEVIYAQLSRKACGACHDHVDFNFLVVGDYGTMTPQLNDVGCQKCHFDVESNVLAPRVAHVHPLLDPLFHPGLVVELLSVVEAGVHDGDGTLDPGEGVAVTLAFHEADGTPVDPRDLDVVEAVLSGPTENSSLVHAAEFPPETFFGAEPFTVPLPRVRHLEFLGDATAAPGDVFTTAGAPHYDVASAPTTIGVRVGFGAGISALTAFAPAGQNFVDVATTANLARLDFLVLGDGTAAEEYLQIQLVEGNRIWFSSPRTPDKKPGLEFAHAAGTLVREVLLAAKTEGVDYALDAASGGILELSELGAGNAVLASYTSPFVMPERYPLALNNSPDIGETLGAWAGKTLVPGTYTLSAWASDMLTYTKIVTPTAYRVASEAATLDVLVGGALTAQPYALIDDVGACNACHQDLAFHDGRHRGLRSCLACHGTSGAEDLPRYVAGNAPPTTGARVDLRSMLHRIHHARLLEDPAAFQLVGAGTDPYPDNFEVSSFATILFPAQPGATRNCAACHGAKNEAWKAPAPREHPSEQLEPILTWRATCGACHDSAAELAHMEVQTSPGGVESCAVCHEVGEVLSVENVHRPR